MTENEAKQKLDSLHYKIVHTSFCNKVYENEIEALCIAKDTLEELQQYRDAEEQGLLLRLPCPIGSTIWKFEYPTKVDENGDEWTILDKKRATVAPLKFALCHLDSIGTLYFVTREEAEQALKQIGE